jgi:hypothetical protein
LTRKQAFAEQQRVPAVEAQRCELSQ